MRPHAPHRSPRQAFGGRQKLALMRVEKGQKTSPDIAENDETLSHCLSHSADF